MVSIVFRAKVTDAELLRAAATKRDESQSEILREALREKASRILLADSAGNREPPQAA